MHRAPNEPPNPPQTMLTRYRGEYAEAVVVNSAVELEQQAPRLQEGLRALVEQSQFDRHQIEYSGFALVFFPEPTEEFSFTRPEEYSAIVEAIRGAMGKSAPVPSDEPVEYDDYHVFRRDCLDEMTRSSGGHASIEGLTRMSFLLAPVTCFTNAHLGDRDKFKQNSSIRLRHASGVRLTGTALIEGMLERGANLDENRISKKEVADYLTSILVVSG